MRTKCGPHSHRHPPASNKLQLNSAPNTRSSPPIESAFHNLASFTTRQLFGGAIVTGLPETFIDASNLEQIPDNQEVFLSPVNDMTYIIEILEKVKVDNFSKAVECASYYTLE